MNRLPRLIPAAAALLIATAGLDGCGYMQPPALTISVNAASDPFFSLSADELFAQLSKAEEGMQGMPTTTAAGPVPADKVAELLTGKVRPRILEQVLAQRKIVPTDADDQLITAAEERQGSQLEPEERAFQKSFVALSRVLAEDFFSRPGTSLDEYARRYYEQRKATFATPAETCMHVVTADATDGQTRPDDAAYNAALPKAQELRRRLDSEPFDKVFESSGRSTENIAGGDLGCRSDEQLPSELTPLVAPLAAGAMSAPLKWRAGWVIVRVDERKPARTPAFEEVQEEVRRATRQSFGQQFVSEVLDKANHSYVVTIDPRFGRWDPNTGQVVRPDGAAVATTPTTPTTLPVLEDDGPATTPGGTTSPSPTPSGSTPPAAAPGEVTTTTRH